MRIIVISDDGTKACEFEVAPNDGPHTAPAKPADWPPESIARALKMAASVADGWSQ